MKWVLKGPSGYVNWPGRKKSFVPLASTARKFDSKEEAEASACGDEVAVQTGGVSRG